MKTMLRIFLGLLLFEFSGLSFAYSIKIKKEVILFPGGDPKIRYQYFEKNGEKILHGLYETFYASGTALQRYRFKHGKLHGKCSEFSHNGKKRWTGSYTQDVKSGLWIYWDRNNTKKVELLLDKQGKIQTIKRYNNLGKKKRQEWYKNERLVKEKNWGRK
jgi:antitoxin component YwqK of YwqJK toxin-antitoxin module